MAQKSNSLAPRLARLAPNIMVVAAPVPTAILIAASLHSISATELGSGIGWVIGISAAIAIEAAGFAAVRVLVDGWQAARGTGMHPLPWIVPSMMVALVFNFLAAEWALWAAGAPPVHFAMPVYSLLAAVVAAATAHLDEVTIANQAAKEERTAARRAAREAKATVAPPPIAPKIPKSSKWDRLAPEDQRATALMTPAQIMRRFGVSDTTAYKWKAIATALPDATFLDTSGQPLVSKLDSGTPEQPSNGRKAAADALLGFRKEPAGKRDA